MAFCPGPECPGEESRRYSISTALTGSYRTEGRERRPGEAGYYQGMACLSIQVDTVLGCLSVGGKMWATSIPSWRWKILEQIEACEPSSSSLPALVHPAFPHCSWSSRHIDLSAVLQTHVLFSDSRTFALALPSSLCQQGFPTNYSLGSFLSFKSLFKYLLL